MGLQKGMTKKLGKPEVGSYRVITRVEYDLIKKVTILVPQKGFITNDCGRVAFLTKNRFPIVLSEKVDKYINDVLEAFWQK